MKYFIIAFAILLTFSSCLTNDTKALEMLEVVDFESIEESFLDVETEIIEEAVDDTSTSLVEDTLTSSTEDIITPIVEDTLTSSTEDIITPIVEDTTPAQAQLGSLILPQWFCYTAGFLILAILLSFCYISNQRHKKS